jgi:hypothetical protein
MTNQEQDRLEAHAIAQRHLEVFASVMSASIYADNKEVLAQMARLHAAVHKFAALPAIPVPQQPSQVQKAA